MSGAVSAGLAAAPSPPMAFTVDPWDPGYGQAFAEEQEGAAGCRSRPPSLTWTWKSPLVSGDRSTPTRPWCRQARCCSSTECAGSTPGSGSTAAASSPSPGIAASLAAGLVVCDGGAHVADVVVERGLFTAAGDAGDLVTRCGRYQAHASEGAGLDKLSQAMQKQLALDRGRPRRGLPCRPPR